MDLGTRLNIFSVAYRHGPTATRSYMILHRHASITQQPNYQTATFLSLAVWFTRVTSQTQLVYWPWTRSRWVLYYSLIPQRVNGRILPQVEIFLLLDEDILLFWVGWSLFFLFLRYRSLFHEHKQAQARMNSISFSLAVALPVCVIDWACQSATAL